MKQNIDRDTSVDPLDDIFTIANIISLLRLCLIPVYLYLLYLGQSQLAAVVFGLAAITDFLDGTIARCTNTVSKLGRLLDPIIDRVLVVSAIIALALLGSLPLWIVIVILLRDLLMLGAGAFLLNKYRIRVDVEFSGKVATTLIFFGFAFLMFGWPTMSGLGIIDASFLPGFNFDECCIAIWLIYSGLLLSLFTTVKYAITAKKKLKEREAKAGLG